MAFVIQLTDNESDILQFAVPVGPVFLARERSKCNSTCIISTDRKIPSESEYVNYAITGWFAAKAVFYD